MEVGLRTPLLDFFRRGEVPRDVRLLAAEGAVAPRPIEQLGLLMLLSTDTDTEVQATAERTLRKLQEAQVAGLIARADTPTELRAFFVARGIVPAAVPSTDGDDPLVDTDATDYGPDAGGTPDTASASGQAPGRHDGARKSEVRDEGTREMRAVLIRDPNRIVASAVLSCPKVTEQEVETFARMANVSDDILRTIGATRAWMKNYNIMLGLTKNPKTPLAMSLTLLHRLNDRDLRAVSIDRNVPEPLRIAARKKVVISQK